MTYKQFVLTKIDKAIEEHGSLRKAASHYGVDPAIFSKIRSGKYFPKPKTFGKWFPEINNMKFEEADAAVICQTIIVESKDLDELKRKLSILGYEIVIRKAV